MHSDRGASQSPVKSCTLDPVLTFLVRDFVDLLLPFLTTMVNMSLMQGQLPASQKHAVVTPRLKRSSLDPTDIANFQPVSNLTFMSKVVDRAAASQLNAYLSASSLQPHHQLAYRQKHSTKTAMLRVWSDILTSADVGEVTLLGLLDFSVAFNCVDHGILLQRLDGGRVRSRGHGSRMDLLVPDRLNAAGLLSSMQYILFGLPQGSVLGPLLYVLYTAELEQIVARHHD